MTEENTNVGPEKESVATRPSAPSPKPAPSASPKVVKEAEHKLKEMSRKAKERQHEATRRKTAQNNARHQKGLSEVNYFWLVIGGLGALGVGYLVFGPDRREPEVKPRQRFKYVPPPKPKTPETTPVVEKEEKTSEAPKFELNCF